MYVLIRKCELAESRYDYCMKPLFFKTLEEAKIEEKQFTDFCFDYPCNGETYIAKII